MATTYRADWVFTGNGEPIRNGVLVVAGEEVVEIMPWNGHRVDVDLGQSLLIPGLVNRHVHLDLGGLRGKLSAPKSFPDWLMQVIDFRRSSNPSEWESAIEQGVRESIQAGIVFLSDISVDGKSEQSLRSADLCAEVCLELIGLSSERAKQALEQACSWVTSIDPQPIHALSPHAPYTVSHQLLEGLLDLTPDVSISMHVAETREEIQLLNSDNGPFKEFLQNMGVWHPENLVGSIDELLEFLSGFDEVNLIHGNYLTQDQWRGLEENFRVVYCPRTHAYFGHEPHPYLQMLADGVPLALGTDSLASNPDLSILNEARFLWQRDRAHLTGQHLLTLATDSGESVLLPLGRADFIVIPHDNADSDPWELLWNGTAQPSAIYIQGKVIKYTDRQVGG